MNQSDEQASRWKEDIPYQPLNIIDTRTFAERVEEVLTIEAFRAWLESKDGDEIVGVSGSTRKCPVHHFLGPHFPDGERQLEVERLEVLYRVDVDMRAALPVWAESFAVRVDESFGYGSYGKPVTAEEALAILAEVEKELADTSEKEGG